MAILNPDEQLIQSYLSKLEAARGQGSSVDKVYQPSMMHPIMNAAFAEAVRRQGAIRPVGVPGAQTAPTEGPDAATSGYGNPRLTRPADITPQQGGVWADAEEEQRKRALLGLPGIK